jgi:GxxExxY protein
MMNKENEKDISKITVDFLFKVHTTLGPGLLESTYETCLFHELRKRNLLVERQKILPVSYDDIIIDAGYRIDLLIEGNLILELKAVEKMIPLYQA